MQECRLEETDDSTSVCVASGDPSGKPIRAAAALAPAFSIQGTKVKVEPSVSYAHGAAWALFAISIWAGWFVSSRFNVTTNLTAYDLVALRFGVAAILLSPMILHMRAGYGRVTALNGLLLFVGSGAVYSLFITAGVAYAPAAEGAALMPGVMPMATALLSVLILKEQFVRRQLIGFAFTLTGIIAIAGFGMIHGSGQETLGHLLFVAAAFLFACYTIALRRSGLSGLQATAIVSFFSCVAYLPVYVLVLHPRIFEAPIRSVLFPAFYQGVLTNVVSLIAYGRAVKILGAASASAFAALVPALTLLLAIPFLGEFPSIEDCLGIVAVSIGVFLTSRVATSKEMLQK